MYEVPAPGGTMASSSQEWARCLNCPSQSDAGGSSPSRSRHSGTIAHSPAVDKRTSGLAPVPMLSARCAKADHGTTQGALADNDVNEVKSQDVVEEVGALLVGDVAGVSGRLELEHVLELFTAPRDRRISRADVRSPRISTHCECAA